MATKDQYAAAADAVRAGNATDEQRRLNNEMANNAGSEGSNARRAREEAGKQGKQAKSWF